MTENIATRAMLINLSFGQWTARKLDREASAEVTNNHAAASDAGRFNKQIISKEALAPMAQIVGAARTYFYNHTLPWSDTGYRCLSSMIYFDVMDKLREFKAQFHAAADTFCAEYGEHRERARLRLNSLFKDAEYPAVEDVRRKFYMDFHVMPLPLAGDFRVDIGKDAADKVREELERDITSRVQGMVDTVWEELEKTVTHMRDQLTSGKRLHDSTLDNMVDLLHRLPGLNITHDAGIEEMRKELATLTAGLDMKDIRKDSTYREVIAERADDILKRMADYV